MLQLKCFLFRAPPRFVTFNMRCVSDSLKLVKLWSERKMGKCGDKEPLCHDNSDTINKSLDLVTHCANLLKEYKKIEQQKGPVLGFGFLVLKMSQMTRNASDYFRDLWIEEKHNNALLQHFHYELLSDSVQRHSVENLFCRAIRAVNADPVLKDKVLAVLNAKHFTSEGAGEVFDSICMGRNPPMTAINELLLDEDIQCLVRSSLGLMVPLPMLRKRLLHGFLSDDCGVDFPVPSAEIYVEKGDLALPFFRDIGRTLQAQPVVTYCSQKATLGRYIQAAQRELAV